MPSDEPYITGSISASAAGEIRVEERPEEAAGGAKAVILLTPETRVLHRSGSRASARDLRPGTGVSAWITGDVQESYPVRATASTVVIEPETR